MTALATFDDGTQIVIVTEPAMSGVVLNPTDEGVTFTVYPRRCPSWGGRLEINDDGDGFSFDVTCQQGSDRAIGYLSSH
jgi:ribosomal protein L21E